ncbi:MAG: hypothetical protein R3B81_05815 [bacterium]
MTEPRIVTTRVTRSEGNPQPLGGSRPGAAVNPLPYDSDVHRERSRRGIHPVLFGLLLLSGGVAVYGSVRGDGADEVPKAWRQVDGPDAPATAMVSEVKTDGSNGSLLRLEWPAHPKAESYRIRFIDARGAGPAEVPVQSNVFLYDLSSDVLHLPRTFDWIVTAVLPDGSEIVTPKRHHP